MTSLSSNCYKYSFDCETSHALFDRLDALFDCYVHSTTARDEAIEFCIETDSEEQAQEIRHLLFSNLDLSIASDHLNAVLV